MKTTLYELYEKDSKGKPWLLVVSSDRIELERIKQEGDWIEAHEYVRIES